MSGNTWPQSSQLAEPLWTDPGVKIGISVRELISTKKKKKKKKKKNTDGEWMNILPKFLQAGEKATTTLWSGDGHRLANAAAIIKLINCRMLEAWQRKMFHLLPGNRQFCLTGSVLSWTLSQCMLFPPHLWWRWNSGHLLASRSKRSLQIL